MLHFVLAATLCAMLGFSVAEDLLEGIDNKSSEVVSELTDFQPSGNANIFSDDLVGPSQDLAGQTLFASNDVNIFSTSGASSDPDPDSYSDLYADPLLLAASTCSDRANADEEVLLTSKLRARDSATCYSKEPNKDSTVEGWFKRLPNIFGGNKTPVPETEPEPAETQYFGFDRLGNSDKCSPPYKYNLCCNGDLDGNIDHFVYDELAVPLQYWKVEDCYESMYMPFQDFRFNLER